MAYKSPISITKRDNVPYHVCSVAVPLGRATDFKARLTSRAFFMDFKQEEVLKPISIVITFALAVVARNLLNEEKIKFRAFIGEMILAVIFGLLLIFTGVVKGTTYAETMVIACGCGLGLNRSVQWLALGFINRFLPKGGK